jgi:rhomboid protease GluP
MSLDNQEQPEPNSSEPSQAQAVTRITPYFSIILIASIVIVWVVQVTALPQESPLLGGKVSAGIAGLFKSAFLEGQYWRLLTSATVHGGIIHLAFNAYALYVLGRLIETLSNRSHLAIVFLLSAIGGGLMSLAFMPGDIPSVGASGGIIGFLGYLTAYGFKRRKLVSNAFLKNMLFNIGLIGFLGVFVIPNVDNFGHLGGLVVGLIYGFIQIPNDLYKDPRVANKTIKILGYICLAIFILTCLFTVSLMLLWRFYL